MHKDNVRTGQRVVVTLKSPRKLHGVVKYIGRINSLPGDLWIGIELNEPHPDGHDGNLEGRYYFNSRAYHGVFAAPHQVELESTYLRRLRIKRNVFRLLNKINIFLQPVDDFHLRHLVGTKPEVVDDFDFVFSSDKPVVGFGLDTTRLLASRQ